MEVAEPRENDPVPRRPDRALPVPRFDRGRDRQSNHSSDWSYEGSETRLLEARACERLKRTSWPQRD